jgi:hypothetical protein
VIRPLWLAVGAGVWLGVLAAALAFLHRYGWHDRR